MTTTWQARLSFFEDSVESCLFWPIKQRYLVNKTSTRILALQVLLSLWASKNLEITDMCSSQISKDLSASFKQFLSLAFPFKWNFSLIFQTIRKSFFRHLTFHIPNIVQRPLNSLYPRAPVLSVYFKMAKVSIHPHPLIYRVKYIYLKTLMALSSLKDHERTSTI